PPRRASSFPTSSAALTRADRAHVAPASATVCDNPTRGANVRIAAGFPRNPSRTQYRLLARARAGHHLRASSFSGGAPLWPPPVQGGAPMFRSFARWFPFALAFALGACSEDASSEDDRGGGGTGATPPASG